ncbi:hypothetical protein GCM10009127_11540 [Alteraurantiacibacter aestuarii]|uniref:Lipoprotein n=1 Tax=Alteraurantiacibacter aestuarii TaxID=650004 RepID=A0A844ZG94_9SPHN|nr:hypothetical protein [Alteraurantiacibacter aestuarii]MXO87541.1 hypothetical protein [Alteraurantiacibacter aestuarii]
MRIIAACLLAAMLAACSADHDAAIPGNAQDDQPFAGIGEDEVIRLTGTEPFWGGEISGGLFTYTTPENIEGQRLPVTRFAGRGGLSFSAEADGVAVDMAITPAACSDGMSDRTYPFTVTLQWGEDQRIGCGWSDVHPFSGGAEQELEAAE